ncbi:3-isopropylmalate dehydratase small subunit [Rhizorhabdus argentea]|uniref:3-isopropylmalate dehydratase small subunit n=1 Tax=Rhizorhabdus argentea TaxID=1387174 RepID=UPI0030EB3C70
MKPFINLDAVAAPLPLANVDTDKILAGRFLKTISREGLGDKLFWSLRQDPGFVLNQLPWRNAGILITLDNFGCGSSREHAPWALLDFGIRCIIAPRFADIFYNNCFKNGILPIMLSETTVDRLMAIASDPETARMSINLVDQTIQSAAGVMTFDVDAGRKADMIGGIDEISRSLDQRSAIDAFEAQYFQDQPWLRRVGPAAL